MRINSLYFNDLLRTLRFQSSFPHFPTKRPITACMVGKDHFNAFIAEGEGKEE